MSNDLISRKALMVAINTDFYEHFTVHYDSDQTALIDMVMNDIEEIPTAYDVDSVCKELDKASDYYETNEQGKENVQMVSLTDALEIVRSGGKNK